MRGLVIAVLLGLTMDVTSGRSRIQLIPQYPAINGSVTLSVTGITGRIGSVSWYKGPRKESWYQILAYFPGIIPQLFPGALHNPRFSVFDNGSLQIKDLHITDGGNYIGTVQTSKQEDVSVTLTLYEPVIKPKITASTTQPKENDPFTLTCYASNAMKMTWARPGTSISPETKLSGDNKTLTFSRITREDAGEYQCEAQNLASKDSSDPYTVTVVYGPDKAQIGGTLFVNSGSSIILSCSADSFPPPEYQWKVNGTVSQEKTERYSISNAVTEDEGTYTCVVRNPVTGRAATASVYVTVTAESIIFIIGLVFAIILGLVLIIIGSIFLYRKCGTKRLNESSENRRELISVYQNIKGAQPKEEPLYTDLLFTSEETYTEITR